jgi:hypothetical protein
VIFSVLPLFLHDFLIIRYGVLGDVASDPCGAVPANRVAILFLLLETLVNGWALRCFRVQADLGFRLDGWGIVRLQHVQRSILLSPDIGAKFSCHS